MDYKRDGQLWPNRQLWQLWSTTCQILTNIDLLEYDEPIYNILLAIMPLDEHG